MQIEHIPPRSLKPHPCNSRVHPTEQIAALVESYRQFGFNGLVVIDEDGTILAGHGRTQAAIQAELETVPCRRVIGWTDEKKRAYVIADNQIADASDWNMEMLTAELDALQGSGIDMAAFGIDIDALLPPPEPPTGAATMREAEGNTDKREPIADDQAFRDEMADKRTHGQAPIVPMYAEHHQAFIVVCDNEIDEAWIRQRLGLNRPQQSYSDVKILTPNVITVAQLRALLA
jgi:hypothetical protein